MLRYKDGFAALAGAALVLVSPAQAGSLWWSKFPVRTDTEAKCMQLAYGVVAQNGVQSIRRSALEIAGTKAGTYVAITCVGRSSGQQAIAVVMTQGDNDANVRAVRDEISDKLKAVGFID